MNQWTDGNGNSQPEVWALALHLAHSLQQVSLGAQVPQQRITDELSEVVYSEARHPVDALALIVLALEILNLEGNETACTMLQNAASALEKTTGFASESFSSAVRIEH